MGAPNQYEYYSSAKVNNLLIPTGSQPQPQFEVATFRDENTSINGQNQYESQPQSQFSGQKAPQYDALGYGTFQPD